MEGFAWMERPVGEDAFDAAVSPHYPGLVRRLTVVLGGDVDAGQDAAQEALDRAFRAWDRFDGTDARAWLHTIGLRLAFNERRRKRRWGRLIGRADAEPTWVHPEDVGLHDALGRLRREHRAALLLTLVDGYTHDEAAAMLDVAPGTIASWVSRAKARLREDLTDG